MKITSVEQTFTQLRPERVNQPNNQYFIEGTTDHGKTFDLSEGAGLGKLELAIKVRIVDEPEYPAISVEAIAALPTATTDFGSNGVDTGLRLALAQPVGERFVLYGGSAVVIPGEKEVDGIRLQPIKGIAFAAAEYKLTEWLSAIYQVAVETPTSRDLDGTPGLLIYHGGGVKASVDRYFMECGVVENGGDVKRTADFSLHASVGCKF